MVFKTVIVALCLLAGLNATAALTAECHDKTGIELLGHDIGCAMRNDMRAAARHKGLNVVREDDRLDTDRYDGRTAPEMGKGLDLTYMGDGRLVAATQYSAQGDTAAFHRILALKAKSYGAPHTETEDPVTGAATVRWLMPDMSTALTLERDSWLGAVRFRIELLDLAVMHELELEIER